MALEELKEEAKTEGKPERKMEKEIRIIRKMLKNGLAAATICHWLDVERKYVEKIAELQIKYPDYSNAQILDECRYMP